MYPYDYMVIVTELPSQEAFYNKLSGVEWSGLFYHKKNVHGSNVRSKSYDGKMEAKE